MTYGDGGAARDRRPPRLLQDDRRRRRAVEGVSLSLDSRQTLGIVGESGSGKSVTAQTIIGLTRFPNATISGRDPASTAATSSRMPADALREIRGNEIAMIFQDPLSSLHPFYRVGHQIVEAIRVHEHVSRDLARKRTIEALRSVGIPSPERALRRATRTRCPAGCASAR